MERSISEREQKLKELGEPELVAREKAAEAKLAEAKELMASYDKEKHAAAINLNQSFERDRTERAAAVPDLSESDLKAAEGAGPRRRPAFARERRLSDDAPDRITAAIS